MLNFNGLSKTIFSVCLHCIVLNLLVLIFPSTVFPLTRSNFFCLFSWLPEHVTLLARFVGEPSPVKSTVTKAVAEFRRTHADTWNLQKDSFTEEQLEVDPNGERFLIDYMILCC